MEEQTFESYGADVLMVSKKIGEAIKDDPLVVAIPSLVLLVAMSIEHTAKDSAEKDLLLKNTIKLLTDAVNACANDPSDEKLQ
jgi:hypothetical protein